jgi:iron complex transport system ATP-binding protein
VLLTADNLRFRYRDPPAATTASAGSRPFVIDDVSLRVPEGGLLGILGPNGSGKTTLLKLLSGTLAPASGSVAFNGRPLASLPRRERARRMAVVPQETHMAFEYTALEIVLMGRYPWLGAFQVEGPDDIASALEALEATGTRHLAERPYPTLSGGEKQRVIIASVLAQLDRRHAHRGTPGSSDAADGGALLFLDEPTASLDLKYQIEIAALVRRLHDDTGIGVVLSTHDLRLVASVCTWVVLLSNGRLLAEGPPRDMLTPPLIGQLYDIGAEAAAPALGR